MAITATFQIDPEKLQTVVRQIYETTSALAELTPRSEERLTELANANTLAVVYKENEIIGWAAVEKLTKNLSEIGMVTFSPPTIKLLSDTSRVLGRQKRQTCLAQFLEVGVSS
jgi:hypothetical protein